MMKEYLGKTEELLYTCSAAEWNKGTQEKGEPLKEYYFWAECTVVTLVLIWWYIKADGWLKLIIW